MPRTRYQGSKRKLVNWIWDCLAPTEFQTMLDAFSGSASVSYALKTHGKRVTCNDVLRSNFWTAVALIENDDQRFPVDEIDDIFEPRCDRVYDDFIERTFADIYFLDDENRTLDVACQNIAAMDNRFHKAIAYYALFQAAIAKRPYNLFHRKNLYMRTAKVRRSFGNKATWDRGFHEHVRTNVLAANGAVLNNGAHCRGARCRAVCGDVFEIEGTFDLVYIDPPYLNGKGVGVDYHGFYHFLEGMVDYASWPAKIDYGSKHRRLVPVKNAWTNPREIHDAFRRLFQRFADSTLVVSYRSDGIPTIDELADMLRAVKPIVEIHEFGQYKYVLSTNGRSREVLLIGRG